MQAWKPRVGRLVLRACLSRFAKCLLRGTWTNIVSRLLSVLPCESAGASGGRRPKPCCGLAWGVFRLALRVTCKTSTAAAAASLVAAARSSVLIATVYTRCEFCRLRALACEGLDFGCYKLPGSSVSRRHFLWFRATEVTVGKIHIFVINASVGL